MMTSYKLYCFGESGNAYKAALMLSLCGLQWTPQWVDFFNGETRTPKPGMRVSHTSNCPCRGWGRFLMRTSVRGWRMISLTKSIRATRIVCLGSTS